MLWILERILSWGIVCSFKSCVLYIKIFIHGDNLIKITSLTYSLLLICRSMWNLRNPITCHIWVTLSNDHYHPLKTSFRRLWLNENLKLNFFICCEHYDWLIKVVTHIFLIFYYSWHMVTRMWSIMGFLQISDAATY